MSSDPNEKLADSASAADLDKGKWLTPVPFNLDADFSWCTCLAYCQKEWRKSYITTAIIVIDTFVKEHTCYPS